MKLKINKIHCNTISFDENNYKEYIENRENATYLKKEVRKDTCRKPVVNHSKSKPTILKEGIIKIDNSIPKSKIVHPKKLKDNLYTGYEVYGFHKDNG